MHASRRWIDSRILHEAYKLVLRAHASAHDEKDHIVDSSHVKNVYGRCGLGRSPVDRGRKGWKVSILTDCNGIMHNMRADPANVSDYKLFTPMLTSMLINLRRLEAFSDKGYDPKANRQAAYVHGFLPRIIKRKCRSSRRQNGKRVRVKMAGHASEPSKAQVLWEKGDARMSWEHEMVSPTQFHD